MTIGNKIKQYRKNKQLTQQQLGDLINKSLRTIQKYEANQVTPSFKVLEEIAKALDVSYNDFFDKPSDNNEVLFDLSNVPTEYLIREIERRCLK